MPYIGNFGFRTSDTYDKFAKYETAVSEVGSPYCPEHACAVYGLSLIHIFLFFVLSRREISIIKTIVYEHDADAMLIITDVNEAIGYGFKSVG